MLLWCKALRERVMFSSEKNRKRRKMYNTDLYVPVWVAYVLIHGFADLPIVLFLQGLWPNTARVICAM